MTPEPSCRLEGRCSHSVCLCAFLVTLCETRRTWLHFVLRTCVWAEYFGCEDDLFARFRGWLEVRLSLCSFCFLLPSHCKTKILLKTTKLWTVIADKPCDAFEYRLNRAKVPAHVCVFTFKSSFYVTVCQSNVAPKFLFFLCVSPSSPIHSLWGFLASFFANYVAMVTRND